MNTMYHSTLELPGQAESIEKEGLKAGGRGTGFTLGGSWAKDIYGTQPIYLSAKPSFGGDRSYEGIPFKVNVSGLKLVADLPTLVDYGAYVEEEGMYWEYEREPKEMSPLVDGDGMVFFEDLLTPGHPVATAAIKLTGTAASLEDISPERVERFVSEGILRTYVRTLLIEAAEYDEPNTPEAKMAWLVMELETDQALMMFEMLGTTDQLDLDLLATEINKGLQAKQKESWSKPTGGKGPDPFAALLDWSDVVRSSNKFITGDGINRDADISVDSYQRSDWVKILNMTLRQTVATWKKKAQGKPAMAEHKEERVVRERVRRILSERPATDEERAKMLYFFFRDSSRMGIQLAEMLMPGTAEELVKFVAVVDMFIEMGERLINQKPGEKIDGSLPRLRSIWFEIAEMSTKMSSGISFGEYDVPHAEYLWRNDLLDEVYRSIKMVLSSTFITWTPAHQELLDGLKEWARQ